MVNCMRASLFLPEIQYFKLLKSVFLIIYNCARKPGFLESVHTYTHAHTYAHPHTKTHMHTHTHTQTHTDTQTHRHTDTMTHS